VLVCGGSKTRAHVRWKARDSAGRLRDRDLVLSDGYPSRAEITLLDTNHRPLLKPVVLEITEAGGELSVDAKQQI
jgi:hypothetical protein